MTAARARSIAVHDLTIELRNRYSMTGSFFRGTGKGFGEPAQILVTVHSPAARDNIDRLVRDAVAASPALATMRMPLVNTFALYVNGQRRAVTTLPASKAADAADPLATYRNPPSPAADAPDLADIIAKPGETTTGDFALQPAETTGRVVITVDGRNRLLDADGASETYLKLGFPGTSHFLVKADPKGERAPSGLSYVTAGIAFCYMTQLARYIEHMKMAIRSVRLVQSSPYSVGGSPAGADWSGAAEAVDTHLFLDGEESEATYERLMNVAANTCYLHATLGAALEPELRIDHRASAAA